MNKFDNSSIGYTYTDHMNSLNHTIDTHQNATSYYKKRDSKNFINYIETIKE